MNIYVGNVDTQLSNEELNALFQPFGAVRSAAIEIDVFTDRSRGFGYVDMPNEAEAKAAIAALHQSSQGNRQLTVHEAPVKEVRKGSYKVGSAGGVNPYRFKKN